MTPEIERAFMMARVKRPGTGFAYADARNRAMQELMALVQMTPEEREAFMARLDAQLANIRPMTEADIRRASMGDPWAQVALQTAQGATFGLADEGAGTIEYLVSRVKGLSHDEAMRRAFDMRSSLHEATKAYMEEHPYAATTLQVMGGVAGPYMLGAWPGKAAKLAEPLAKRAASGIKAFLLAKRAPQKVASVAAHTAEDMIKAVPGSGAVLGAYGFGQADSTSVGERLKETLDFTLGVLPLSVALAPAFHAGGHKVKEMLDKAGIKEHMAKFLAKWAQDASKLNTKHFIKHDLLGGHDEGHVSDAKHRKHLKATRKKRRH